MRRPVQAKLHKAASFFAIMLVVSAPLALANERALRNAAHFLVDTLLRIETRASRLELVEAPLGRGAGVHTEGGVRTRADADARLVRIGAIDQHAHELVAAAAALDVAAYDQRGCLSPQVIYVEETRARSAEAFAESLARGLETALPRGPLPLPAGAAQAQWRGLAEVEGRLIQGDSYAISVRPAESIRWSPAYRNVNVSPVASPSEAATGTKSRGAPISATETAAEVPVEHPPGASE